MLAGSSTQHQDAKTDKGWELYVGAKPNITLFTRVSWRQPMRHDQYACRPFGTGSMMA